MTRSIFITAALSLAVLTAGAASAQDRQPEQVRVSAKHVDFNNARDARGFYDRLTAAAHQVCSSEVSDPMTDMADAACVRDAVADAVKQIGAPKLSALDGQASNHASAFAMNDRQH